MEALIEGLLEGRHQACRQVWDRYGKGLIRIVQDRMPHAVQARLEAEDVVQSACVSFFRRARDGEFEIPDDERLWRLLCAISLNKLRMKVRFHSQEKRDVGVEQPLAVDERSSSPKVPQAVQEEATPEEIVAFAEQWRLLLDSFDERQRTFVEARLQGASHAEIAEQLACSVRSVGRLAQEVRATLRSALLESWPREEEA